MNNNNLSATLNQGLQFQKYQRKISSKKSKTLLEGFTNSTTTTTTTTDASTDPNKPTQQDINDLMEFKKMQVIYNALEKQYKIMQMSINNDANKFSANETDKNEYATKNVMLGGGQLGYVTNNGEYKWYSSWDVINNTAGKNGCPVLRENEPGDYTAIDQTTDNYNVPGTVISTNPRLTVGGAMVSGQSCGNEGSNVFVNNVGKSTATYSGCFKDDANHAMSLEDGGSIFNYETCKQRAQDVSAKYFGLQNFNDNGFADCYTSNDYDKTIKYGSGDTFSETVLWSLDGKKGSGTMMLKNDGNINLYDTAGNVIVNSNTGDVSCTPFIPSNILATWGGNVDGVTEGNASTYVNKYNTGAASFSYTVGKDQKDPAKGKEKTFDISYNCGDKIKSQHVDKVSDKQTVVVDCSDQPLPCRCYLILEDGGIVAIYKGDSPSNNSGNIYKFPAYDVSQSTANPDFKVENGKTATNWIAGDSGLGSGEWIASNDGLLVLMMQTDGKLCIKTYQQLFGCPIRKDGNAYGDALMNAVYTIDNLNDNSNNGKIGYVNEMGKLREYPSSMIGKSKMYSAFPNYNYSGNDVSNMPITNSTNQDCRQAADDNADSGGYVFDNSSKNCWVKNNTLNLSSKRTPTQNVNLFVKKPLINNSDSCGKKYVEIDSSTWANYQKGDEMTPDAKCGLGNATSKQHAKLEELRSQLNKLGSKMIDKINSLQSSDTSLNTDMSSTREQLDKNLREYSKVQTTADTIKNTSIATANGMLTDSDLVVLQENYGYLFWSIFAVGLVVVTMNVMKKS